MERNGLNNVTVIGCGVSNKAERRSLNEFEGNTGRNFCGEVSEHGVPMCRLCDAIPPDELARVSFVKIDLEGMEDVVLADLAEMTLAPDMIIAAELWLEEGGYSSLQSFLERGFSLWMLPNDYRMEAYASGLAQDPIAFNAEESRIVDVVLVAPERT